MRALSHKKHCDKENERKKTRVDVKKQGGRKRQKAYHGQLVWGRSREEAESGIRKGDDDPSEFPIDQSQRVEKKRDNQIEEMPMFPDGKTKKNELGELGPRKAT